MKKLMMAAAIVCTTIVAQAATVQWKTGTQIKPDGANYAAAQTLNMYVWSVTETVFNDTAIDEIWGEKGNASLAEMAKTANFKGEKGAGAAGITVNQDSGNDTYTYGLVITAWDSNKDGTVDMYAANKFAAYVNTSGSVTAAPNNMAKYIGGVAGSGNVKWETVAVPEPTSAMLLLLGVAGLALRRRRA